MEDRPSALAAATYASESHTHPQCTQVAQNSEFCSEIGGLSVSSTKVCDDPCHQGGRILRDLWLLLWRTRDFSKCKVSLGVSGRLRCLPRHPLLLNTTPHLPLLQQPQHFEVGFMRFGRNILRLVSRSLAGIF